MRDFFRAFEAAIWEEISRRFEGIIGCCSDKDQSAFSEFEKLLFEMIRRKSFESMRGSCRFGSMQGFSEREERTADAADFYLDQGAAATSRDHH